MVLLLRSIFYTARKHALWLRNISYCISLLSKGKCLCQNSPYTINTAGSVTDELCYFSCEIISKKNRLYSNSKHTTFFCIFTVRKKVCTRNDLFNLQGKLVKGEFLGDSNLKWLVRRKLEKNLLEQVLLALNLFYLFILCGFWQIFLYKMVFVQDGDTSEVSSKQLTCLVKELKGRIEVIFFH